MLCQFAQNFPVFVANFLDLEANLKRRFREETVTDLLMGGLAALNDGSMLIQFPDEPSTGADMEWNFIDKRTGSFFRVLLQAKRSYGKGKFWKRHSYRELFHQSGGKPQAKALRDEAQSNPSTYPLYCFYHPKKTCELAAVDNARIEGLGIADGYLISSLALSATNRVSRIQSSCLGSISPLLMPLSGMFCPPNLRPVRPMALAFSAPRKLVLSSFPPGLAFEFPPTPHQMRERILKLRQQSEKMASSLVDAPAVPEVASSAPADVLRLLERGTTDVAGDRLKPSNVWRVVFLSASEEDERVTD